jgi:hypothetical protein
MHMEAYMRLPFVRHVVVATAVLTASACAPVQKGTAGTTAAAEESATKVGNQIPFDIAACQAAPAEQPQPANMDTLTGAMVGSRAAVMECLVAPTSRGAAKSTLVVIKASVNAQGGKHTVSGDNLTPEGQACVQKAVETAVPLVALPKGAQPLGPEVEFAHDSARSMAVTLGTDPGSDFSGAVRLGQAQWCDCYAPFATKVPPMLKARIKLAKGQATPAEVTFEPATTPEGTALASCLQQKMMALPVNAASDMQFTRSFTHFNSRATEPSDLPAPQRFLQVNLVRNQRAADSTLAYGMRTSAAEAYDAMFLKHQKTKDRKLAAELPVQCKKMVEATTKWVGALEAQIKTDQEALAILQELKVKDAATWAPAETQLNESVARIQEDLTHAQTQLKTDQDTCPKG